MMTREEWESLAGSPGWPKLKQYLFDYRAAIAEQMARGQITKDEYPMAVMRCQTAADLANISLADIDKFYGVEPKEEDVQDES